MALIQLSLMGRSSNQPTSAASAPRADERPAAGVRPPVTRDAERWAASLLSQLDWDPRQR